MDKKISLIVTVYNRLEYARNIIKCLLNQTEQIYELIFADDGSSEILMDYIEDLIPKCKFKIKHVYQEDRGFRLSKSRNNGVRASEGDYLIFLDQDVVFENEFIKEISGNLEKDKILMSRPYMATNEETEKIQKLINEGKEYEFILKELKNEAMVNKMEKLYKKDRCRSFLHKLKLKKRGAKIVGLFFALSKENYIKVNGFDENYEGWGREDDDFGNRLFKMGVSSKPIKFTKNIIHMYHPFDPTKKESANDEYYEKRKKEISKNNYRCKYGYDENINIVYKKLGKI